MILKKRFCSLNAQHSLKIDLQYDTACSDKNSRGIRFYQKHMKAALPDIQDKIRRKALETMNVYDLNTSETIGQIMDLSGKGMKISGDIELSTNQIYYCKVPLEKNVEGSPEVFVDAECRWCHKNSDTGKFDSGYLLRFPTPKDARIIKKITHAWMKGHSEILNSRYKEESPESQGGLIHKFLGNLVKRKTNDGKD